MEETRIKFQKDSKRLEEAHFQLKRTQLMKDDIKQLKIPKENA